MWRHVTCFGVQAFKGEYSWMLYGDDDTFFFLDNILELLQDFDPNIPYIITGDQLDSQQFDRCSVRTGAYIACIALLCVC